MTIKELVLEFIEFLKYQVLNDRCTPEQLRGIYKTFAENMAVDATIGDIAKHYGQSESNVRNVAARSYIGKPKRKVFYNFMKFSECVPASWHEQREQHTSE